MGALVSVISFFFFQAEDGIRDVAVTGVQTCALPISPGFSPPELVVQVKAIACEFPSRVGAPFSRWSVAELGSHVRACGLTASLSDTTIWRWLNEDAIRPWQHCCWIFPRDPHFESKAGRILDLYQRIWKGRKLSANEFVRPSIRNAGHAEKSS